MTSESHQVQFTCRSSESRAVEPLFSRISIYSSDPFFSLPSKLLNGSMFRHANEGDKLISIYNLNNSRIDFEIVDREIKSRMFRSIIFSNLQIKIFNISFSSSPSSNCWFKLFDNLRFHNWSSKICLSNFNRLNLKFRAEFLLLSS